MSLIDIVLIVAVAALVALAAFFLIRNKKKGGACAGCSHAAGCSSHNQPGGCSGQ